MRSPPFALADVAPVWADGLGLAVIAGLLVGVIALVLVIRWAIRRGKSK
jgi:hypothetical protein